MIKGLFINSPTAKCSIHESGRMIYGALSHSTNYTLDYIEIDPANCSFRDNYNFYAFNYHPHTMSWLDTRSIQKLPGLKIAFVLETLPNDPFPMCPPDIFDVYCAIDPTMNHKDKRVYAFPRPLESMIYPHAPPKIPTIGTFGFATTGKGFELVVDAVNKEFDEAYIRINIPYHGSVIQNRYADTLERTCIQTAKRGIIVSVTHDYMTKPQLIDWCSRNTLNCFLYHRNIPGLSATTDQAISSGRPLAVSMCNTFRHIHKYLTPYPERSLRESILKSPAEVARMQLNWSAEAFAWKFEEVLKENSIPRNTTGDLLTLKSKGIVQKFRDIYKRQFEKAPVPFFIPSSVSFGNNVLMISQKERNCGIYQYGRNITNSLVKSKKYSFIFCECGDEYDLMTVVWHFHPVAIIYNHSVVPMKWLTPKITRRIPIPQLGILHEFTQESADKMTTELFDYHLCQDPDFIERNPCCLKTKQLIYPYTNTKPLPDITTVGSFGFGFPDKGFERLVQTVQHEFDEAVINLHMPFNDVVDPKGVHALRTAERCRAFIEKPDITLNVTHNFLTEPELLDFLAGNTINCFFTDVTKVMGISGAIHHALAAHRPIAITKCPMYRDIWDAKPSIFIEDSSLKEIIRNGTKPLEPFYKAWSEEEFIKDYERILDMVLQ